ncbi:predicted protein [Naegleria gruberi]|uniref:Predicted protein n=1 Tax=Naegleria gruberi TaxID=5762 RepID=D2V080_NAEGR|nr:uncharacterized protein NAEGRDRAFT_62200 [Naegleria gruberi]XP_002682238.1 uncharacterized protein NAEGRDRAFT_62225 [Naegleria gruberi]EFC49479.1 predicted protein [Naegleria gruberi]EFC49494.1 predicted protein [Naegleria gruberi]|eukprot:XP_002682223.1 predicted protein [Naegleria gruberi strain NEG-M]
MSQNLLTAATTMNNHEEELEVPGFSWIIESELAGMKFPSLPEHYKNLNHHHIGLVICVNERVASFVEQLPHSEYFNLISKKLQKIENCEEFTYNVGKLNIAHFPINDYGVPNMELMNEMIKLVEYVRKVDSNRGIVVHCMAGLSRTGMILACLLVRVWKMTFEESIKLVNQKRGRNGRGVMTSKQEAFVEDFSKTIPNIQ